ncbi:Kinesin-like protein [Rhynchospora pubera]|uniref:Kinesin-like protein n=1 Tax=Rhynchospora pubera TaxID=906938 RepID=A0AAV8DE43_9POAL|nr:Kinesin-like protein [Rhynchospora pubera]
MKFRSSSKKSASTSCQGEDQVDGVTLKWLQSAGLQHLASPVASLDQQQQLHDLLLQETMGKVPQELSKLTPPEILKTEYITVTNKQSNEKSTDSVLALEKKVGVKAKDEDMTVSKDVDVVAVQFGSPEWSPTRGLYGDYKIIEGFEHKSSTGTHDDDFAFRRDEESSRSSESNTRNKRSLSKMGHISKKSSPSVDNINLDNATPESPTTELNNKFNSSMEDLNELHLSRVSIPSKESIAAENTYKVGVGKMVKSQVVSSPNEINKEINSAIEELSKRHSTRKGRSSSARRNDFLSRESNPVKFRVSGTETEELDPMQFSFYNGSNSNLLTSELEEQSKRPSSSKSIPLSIHRGEFNSEGNNPTKNRVVEIKSETLGSTNISSSRRSESRVKAMSVRRKDINTKETNSDKIRVTGDKSKSIRAKIPAKNEPTVTSKSKEHNLKKASANEQVKKSNEQIHSSISIPIEEALSTCATDVKSEEKNAAKIRVVVRKRPLNKKEMIKKEKDVISVEDIEHITIHEPKVKVDLTAYIEKHEFYFDAVLHEHVTNDEVYNVTVGPSIPTILEQAKITCFAFGPTGSERGADCTHSDRDKRNEGVEINKSLLALKECIRALDNDQNHIPFRGSKLTEVLHDSFIGDSRTVMICCVSPSTGSCEQTLNTLRYAERVRNLSRDGYQKDQGTEILTESNKMDQRIEKITKIEGENNRELYNPSPEMAENLSVRAIYSSKPEIGESSFRFMSNCDFIGSQEDCDPKGQCKIQNNIAGSFSTSYCSSLDFSAKNWLQNYGKEEQIVQPMDQEAGLNIEKDIQAPLKEKEFNLVAENRAILDTLSDSENINKGPEARCSLYEIERNGIDDVDFSYPALSDEEIFVKQMVPQCIEEEALIEKREQRNGVDVSHTTLAKSVERELLLPLEMGNNDLHVISTNNSTKTISDVSTHNALDASGGRKTPNKSPNRRIPRKERNGENRGNLKKEESKSSTKNYKEQYASSADASKEEAPTKEKRATNLVEEEEALLAAHRKVIQNTMNILDEEMNLLVQIDQPGSLINRYVAELSSVLSRKAADLASLQEHVMKFQQGL